MICSTQDCGAEIALSKNFGARFADGKWAVFCETHALAEGLPVKVMNPARLWVVDGTAEAHREAQKAVEDAEAVS